MLFFQGQFGCGEYVILVQADDPDIPDGYVKPGYKLVYEVEFDPALGKGSVSQLPLGMELESQE